MNQRRYIIHSTLELTPVDTLTGGWMVGPHDAAKNYATLYMPGYTVLTPQYVKVQDTKKHGLHTLWKAEAVNQETQHGVIVWIREL